MNKFIKLALSVAFCGTLFLTSVNAAQTNTVTTTATPSVSSEPWSLSLSGVGSTSVKTTTTSIGSQLDLARDVKLVLPLELGVRQGVAYSAGKTTLNTALHLDWRLINIGNFIEILPGVQAGATYLNTPVVWQGGPELIARVYLKHDVYVFGLAQYDFAWNNSKLVKGDNVTYNLGVGFRF